MPLVEASTVSPYPTIGMVMNLSRALVLDTALDISGELLADDQPATETFLNAAWSWFKDKCAISGIERPIRTADIYGLPATTILGVGRAWINWFGCSNGVSQFESPVLPLDLYLPLKVMMRPSGSFSCFQEMRQAESGLPTVIDNYVYDWSDDGLYFYAGTQPMDMQIRYSADLARLTLSRPNDQVPFLGCERSIASRVAYEFSNARGAPQAAAMAQRADDEFEMISQRTGRKNQRRNLRRRPYSS